MKQVFAKFIEKLHLGSLCLSASVSKVVGLQLALLLTHLFSMHPFSTPRKHQKTLRFFDVFRGSE